jgi:hypothetical protein
MGNSLRGIQAALTAAGFGYHKMNSINAAFPTVLQNFLPSTTGANGTTTLADAVLSGVTAPTMGQSLQVELSELGEFGFSNWWEIELHATCTTNGTSGLKLQLTAYDGLVIQSSTLPLSFVYNTAAGSTLSTATAIGSTSTATTTNALSFDIQGLVQIAGYGRLGLQFAQQAASVNVFITGGRIRATAILA